MQVALSVTPPLSTSQPSRMYCTLQSESRSGGATSGTSSIQEAAIVGMPNSPDAIHKAVYYDSSYSPNVVRCDNNPWCSWRGGLKSLNFSLSLTWLNSEMKLVTSVALRLIAGRTRTVPLQWGTFGKTSRMAVTRTKTAEISTHGPYHRPPPGACLA